MTGRIQIVGQTEARRCPYCHDLLDASVQPCLRCDVLLHTECWVEVDMCPLAGCPGRPTRRSRPLTPEQERLREERRARRDRIRAREAARDQDLRDRRAEGRRRPRPSLTARQGPYGRLLGSAVANTLSAVVVLAFFTYLVYDFKNAMSEFGCGVIGGGAIGGLLLYANLSWLAKVPGVYLAIGRMLDEGHPLPARLSVEEKKNDEGQTSDYLATIEVEGRAYRFSINNLLRPEWLDARYRSAPVWLHGCDSGWEPPWILEFSNGLLALVHPSPEELERIRR